MSDSSFPLPDPAAPVYETFVRVRFHEVDSLGHVNNAAYLNYLEQAAIEHATSLGVDVDGLREHGGVFVARRHDIVFVRPAFPGDLLQVVTWLNPPHGASVERNYVVFRAPRPAAAVSFVGRMARGADIPSTGEPVARAMTEWVFVTADGKPRRIPAEVLSRLSPEGVTARQQPRTAEIGPV
jgi:acyl-CoA thioester hydrolase